MPPKLAFILCTAFVAYLLKLDYHRFKEQSVTIWIPTIWILYCASKNFALWSGTYNYDIENITAAIIAGSPMDRNFLSVLIVIGLLILARRKIDWNQVFKDNQWLFLLFLYMLVSILWSDYPFVSLKRWIRVSGTIVMALVVLTGPSPLAGIEAIFRRMIYILIPFSMLLVKYYPEYGVQYGRWSGEPMWTGTAIGKNELGVLCMISALFLIWTWARRRKQKEISLAKYETMTHVVLLGLTFWLLRGPGGAFSATSVVVLIIGLAALFTLRRLKPNANVRAMACVFLLVTVVAYFSIDFLDVITSLTGRDSTLTGRTDLIWSPLISIAMKHPVLGVGYGGFWMHPIVIDPVKLMTVNEAHNGYIDVFIELGTVGLILLAVVIVAFFRKATEVFKNDIEWGSFLLAILLMSLLHNITESSFLKSTLLVWNILVILMVAHPGKITLEQSHSK